MGNHMQNNGSHLWYDARYDHVNAVTPGPDGSHLHMGIGPNGYIAHSDYTFSSGIKAPVNPNVAMDFASFLSREG